MPPDPAVGMDAPMQDFDLSSVDGCARVTLSG